MNYYSSIAVSFYKNSHPQKTKQNKTLKQYFPTPRYKDGQPSHSSFCWREGGGSAGNIVNVVGKGDSLDSYGVVRHS